MMRSRRSIELNQEKVLLELKAKLILKKRDTKEMPKYTGLRVTLDQREVDTEMLEDSMRLTKKILRLIGQRLKLEEKTLVKVEALQLREGAEMAEMVEILLLA